MDFNHTEDRRMLTDTLRRFLSDTYSIEARNEAAYSAPYYNSQVWQQLAELGILSALVDEAHGGFGGSGFDIAVVFEELGRGLCAEPMLATLLCLQVLSDHDENALITAVAGGEQLGALAIYELGNFDTLSDLATQASEVSGAWTLSGRKSVVYGAPCANLFLIAARTEDGLGLFAVEADAQGLEVLSHGMIDGGGAAEIMLTDVPARCISTNAIDSIEKALDAGRLALCAEAVGAMDVLHAMTVEYLGQRKQFGTTIATFQALQHRVVDMAVEIEQARSITILAASKLDEPSQRARYISMAKNLIGRAGILVAEEATQLHGGIGMTWEYAGSHYTKRLIMLDHQLGDRFQHAHRLATEAA